ncbi:beta-galactosidase [Clostridium oryzae]|uniref:Beta-galactosidase n=1 Tax=Clostridium oryzae TaxID=1450648 RepID=A0A1V4IUB2_9CLOT|nr:beta-galactosidase [Clostridium oryzae]OPJ63375.1 beta-galactosidase bgaB [Clostridium oryzae]
MDKLLYGTAYYDEYMPYERLDKDIEMLKEANFNVVRIAESTWGTFEPQNGEFNFTHIDKVMDAMHKAGIYVIIGTPTYAVPTWLVKEHPNVLAYTKNGQNKYGPRQNMDITNPVYLYYAERAIRKLMEHVKDHPSVIGYQADNETKHYDTRGENVQIAFQKYMKAKYKTVENLNRSFGLNYWSNAINSWEDFPNVDATINASLSCEFSKFQRKLVTDFLAWQVSIINEYKRNDQFVTQNFDFEWRGYSYGMQPDVNHFDAAKVFDFAGVDIYHPSQSELTGCEISFCGDIARSMKNNNYLVIETEAQGMAEWVPYPGQLRLQAFSHLASGANMVSYWHWHSIHNAVETYWKGVLSHDFESNPVYEEAKTIGNDFNKLSTKLINLKKENKVAVLFSNEALSALNSFKYNAKGLDYNDVLRLMYDALYKMNVDCDFIDPSSENIEKYSLIVVPPLYAASDELLLRLNKFVENGGHIVYGFRSGFSDENVKVRTTPQPGVIETACGVYYNQFVVSNNIGLKDNPFNVSEEKNHLSSWMELLIPKASAEVLAYYDHPYWGKYAAVVQNHYGKGMTTYIGCLPSDEIIEKIFENALKKCELWGIEQQFHFPIISKSGTNEAGNTIRYYFNYSNDSATINYPYNNGKELLSEKTISHNETITLKPWGFVIIVN